MTTNLLKVTYGNENGNRSSARVHVIAHSPDGGERHIAHLTQGRVMQKTYPARAHHPPEEGGKWTEATYEVAEGAVFKVTVWRKPSFGLPTTAAFFLRSRATAPLWEARIPLLTNPDSALDVAVVSGRFDTLSLEEAEGLGCRVKPLFRPQFDADEVAEACSFVEIEKAVLAKAAVRATTYVTAEGKKEVRLEKRKLRRITLGRTKGNGNGGGNCNL
jgi:hypothetical protein